MSGPNLRGQKGGIKREQFSQGDKVRNVDRDIRNGGADRGESSITYKPSNTSTMNTRAMKKEPDSAINATPHSAHNARRADEYHKKIKENEFNATPIGRGKTKMTRQEAQPANRADKTLGAGYAGSNLKNSYLGAK
jgi:hypothetical protein